MGLLEPFEEIIVSQCKISTSWQDQDLVAPASDVTARWTNEVVLHSKGILRYRK